MTRVSPKALRTIETVAKGIAADFGLQVTQVDYIQSDIGWTLSVIVDQEDGVGVDDCERLARPLSKKLDELNLIRDHYFLEVSSPGVG